MGREVQVAGGAEETRKGNVIKCGEEKKKQG